MATAQQQARRRPTVQKIVIPSGLVKPNETVVIEVPSSLKKHAVVVATRPKGKDRASRGVGDDMGEQQQQQPDGPVYVNVQSRAAYEQGRDNVIEQPQQVVEEAELYDVLETEKQERELLFKNLIAFHKARRNILNGTKAILSRSFTSDNPSFGYQQVQNQSYQNCYGQAPQQNDSVYYDASNYVYQ